MAWKHVEMLRFFFPNLNEEPSYGVNLNMGHNIWLFFISRIEETQTNKNNALFSKFQAFVPIHTVILIQFGLLFHLFL